MKKEIKYLLYSLLTIGLITITSCSSKVVLIHKKGSHVNFKSKDTLLVKSIHRAWFSDSIVVKPKNGSKEKYSNDSIWGYKEINGGLYRYFEGKFFTVQKIDFIWIYSQYHQQHDHKQRKAHTTYYFSMKSNSPIYLLDESNLASQFKSNFCFVERVKNELKYYKDYAAFIKVNGDCKLIDYYKYCKNIIE